MSCSSRYSSVCCCHKSQLVHGLCCCCRQKKSQLPSGPSVSRLLIQQAQNAARQAQVSCQQALVSAEQSRLATLLSEQAQKPQPVCNDQCQTSDGDGNNSESCPSEKSDVDSKEKENTAKSDTSCGPSRCKSCCTACTNGEPCTECPSCEPCDPCDSNQDESTKQAQDV